MPHIAIVGSGPAGYYTAEAALKQWGADVRVDVFDRLPVPYGLIRSGVAPDHQSIKGVVRRFETTALSEQVRFVGNVTVGAQVSVKELRTLYDAVVLATGAPRDRALDLPGDHLRGVTGSAGFVGWYNGHPEFAALDPDLSGETAVVIGMGNVALDIARILAKTPAEFAGSDIAGPALAALTASGVRRIVLLGRRGPHQIQMTPKELGELGDLTRAAPVVDPADLPYPEEDALLDPGQRKSVSHLRAFSQISLEARAVRPIAIEFDFFAAPRALLGEGRVAAVAVERTRIVGDRAVGTGAFYVIPAGLVIASIGYRSAPLPGVPFDEREGRFASEEGRILPGLYCVGWARRGPSGTIGTNRPDGFAVVETIAQDLASGAIVSGAPGAQDLASGARAGGSGFDALAAARGIDVVSFGDWKRIEQAECERAREGAPREKFLDIAAMIGALA